MPVKLLLIGAGLRGKDAYGAWIAKNPQRATLLGVAEPDLARLAEVSITHRIPPEGQFRDWRELLAAGIRADACLVCTQDDQHVAPALMALAAGYDVLLEKPMALNPADCRRLVEAAESSGRRLRVCHVLRYTEFFATVKSTLDSGVLGRIVHINHSENVSWYHFAHSFVRGNWRSEATSSPFVLAKTCHDLDLLFWLAGEEPEWVHSFGQRSFFRSENAPTGATPHCGGCPHSSNCLWYAPKLYRRGEDLLSLPQRSRNPLLRAASRLAVATVRARSPNYQWKGWPTSATTNDLTPAGVERALASGPYGRCVFACDNDAPDHQLVSLQFPSGLTATLTVTGLSDKEGRTLRIEGSEATLHGSFATAGQELEVHEHRTGKRRKVFRRGFHIGDHGGGDAGLMDDFIASYDASRSGLPELASGRASLTSHLMAFAADRSRKENRVVSLKEFL
ncbi:MAG: Gfo/Idh/MocA family oxidoreductase [Spirochaetales bacterium]